MGQTSSQLESTQVQAGARVEEVESSSIDSRESTIQVMSTQPPKRKYYRAPSPSADISFVPAKKLKTATDHSIKPKRHRVGRSIPQHVRGINIRPSQETNPLREVDPAASQNIQQTSLSGPGRIATVNEARDQTIAVAGADEEDNDGDNIQVHHTPAKTVSQPTPRRSKPTKQPPRSASTSADPSSSNDATSRGGREALGISQPIPAGEAPLPAEVLQRARQKLAVQRGEVALAQDPEFGVRFAAEQDKKLKKSMLLDFIERHELDRILVRMFFPAEQAEDEAEEADDVDDADSDRDTSSEEEEEEEEEEVESVVSPAQRALQAEKDTQDTNATSRPENGIPTPSTSSEVQDELVHENELVEPMAETTVNDAQTINAVEYPQPLEYPEKARRISNWLMQPREPVEPNAVDEVASHRGSLELARKKPKKPSPRKKTVARKSAELVVDSDDEQERTVEADADDVSEIEVRPKKKPAAKRKKAVARKSPEVVVGNNNEDSHEPARAYADDLVEAEVDSEVKKEESYEKEKNNLRGIVKGKWTPQDIATAEAVFNQTCNEYRVTYMEMCRKMTDWEGELYDSFKADIYAAFPLRAKAAIRGFCQRRWHDYNTGPWSKEEDALLRQWHAVHPSNWVEIGCMIGGGRTAASCRDRWLGHLQYEGKLNKGPWTKEEEDELMLCVKKQRGEDEGNRVDWNRVAESMGGKRAANKCRTKWNAVQKRQTGTCEKAEEEVEEDEDTMLQHSIMAQMRSEQDEASAPQDPQPMSKKQKEMETKYAKLGWGDVADALDEISSVFDAAEVDIVYTHESTFWSNVSVRLNKRSGQEVSKFKPFPKLRRRCYLGALDRFGDDHIEHFKGMARRAGLLYEKIMDAHDTGEIQGSWRLEDRVRENESRQRANARGGRFLEDGARDVSEAPGSSPPVLPDEDEDEDEDGDGVVIPETQLDDEVAGLGTQRVVRVQAGDDGDDIEDYRTTPSTSRSATPRLGLDDFIRKCTTGRMTDLRKRPTDRAGEDYVEMKSEEGTVYRFEGSKKELDERIQELRRDE